jgi:hypothetical protein
MMRELPHLYELYEQSVQSPDTHIAWIVSLYKERNGVFPVHLREDFCGTFQLSCAWVKRNRRNTATCLDLDSAPLDYGKEHHYSKLTKTQKTRMKILRQSAISKTAPRADVILVGNFSFFILKERKELIRYFRNIRRSVAKDGMFILEMAGGPGMIAELIERRTVRTGPRDKFIYIWDQQDFDPITQNGKYAIHFQFPDGRKIRDAFTYDWRIWTIPEVRDALKEAGFKESVVYWETIHRGKGTGEFIPLEHGDNAFSWIAYVVGIG